MSDVLTLARITHADKAIQVRPLACRSFPRLSPEKCRGRSIRTRTLLLDSDMKPTDECLTNNAKKKLFPQSKIKKSSSYATWWRNSSKLLETHRKCFEKVLKSLKQVGFSFGKRFLCEINCFLWSITNTITHSANAIRSVINHNCRLIGWI